LAAWNPKASSIPSSIKVNTLKQACSYVIYKWYSPFWNFWIRKMHSAKIIDVISKETIYSSSDCKSLHEIPSKTYSSVLVWIGIKNTPITTNIAKGTGLKFNTNHQDLYSKSNVEIIVKADHKKKRKETLFQIFGRCRHGPHCLLVQITHYKKIPRHGKTNEIKMRNKVKFRVKKCINSSFPAG
jgi:hypothetical protein